MLINQEEKIKLQELFQFYLLFFLTVIFVYYSPSFINRLYFLLLLVLFWRSKENYFWFAFVFIVISRPGLLFLGGEATQIHRIPFYNIGAGVSFSFFDIFFILAFLKALIKGKRTKMIFRKPLLLLLFYLIFIFILSLLYGMNFRQITFSLRKFTVFTLFISFPFLVYMKRDLFKFMHLVFPIVFFIVFAQFFWLYTGSNFHDFLMGQSAFDIIELQESTGYRDFIRPMSGGAMSVFFSFIFALFLIKKEDYSGKKFYLYLIVILCLLSGFITATRSWIIMLAIVMFLYFLFLEKEKARLFLILPMILILFLFSFLLIPRMEYSIENSMRRLSTIENLVKGDMTAGGTLQRIDQRLPRVLEGFKKNPILGWGFSETYYEYADAHVGVVNVLLQVGLVGIIPFLYLWIYYLRMLFLTISRTKKRYTLGSSLKVLIIAFMGILILQFTTFAFFAFDLKSDVTFFTIIFICFSDFFIKIALRENKLMLRG